MTLALDTVYVFVVVFGVALCIFGPARIVEILIELNRRSHR